MVPKIRTLPIMSSANRNIINMTELQNFYEEQLDLKETEIKELKMDLEAERYFRRMQQMKLMDKSHEKNVENKCKVVPQNNFCKEPLVSRTSGNSQAFSSFGSAAANSFSEFSSPL